MKCVGYGRASTAKQVASPASQKEAIAAYCKSKGLPFTGAYYIDPSTSGKHPIWDRPAGGEMMKALQRGDHVVVAKLDRLSRSFVSFAKLLDQFERLGITLHIVDMNGVLDPTNPQAMLTIHILVAFAEFERRMISIRTSEGLQSILAEGGKLGKAPVYGKRWIKRWSHRLGKNIHVEEDNPDEVAVINKVLELRVAGHSYDAIRQYLNYRLKIKRRGGRDWTPMALHRLVRMAMERQADAEYHATGTMPATATEAEAEAVDETEEDLTEVSDELYPEDFDEMEDA